MLREFRDIELYAFKLKPNKVILKAKTQDGYPVLIHPQYRIPKPMRLNGKNAKRQFYWYVDLAVEIYDKRDESVVIGIWAMEFVNENGTLRATSWEFTVPEENT
ncbi:TPA: hypothetical protein ACF3XD_004573 [Vibrio parahaemolyticus]|nr:hypothetical protein [Vibrio parahaemolyticus]HCH6205157.1 hypothetical protein [Vibrio parahaemolyticus]